MSTLFGGKFFDHLMRMEPLVGATFFAKGSSTMLYEKDGRLYRLTQEGCGHALLSLESSSGNPNFTKVVRDFGPVAPSDEGDDEFYWLAEVEWLEPLDPSGQQSMILADLLVSVTGDEELVMSEELPEFVGACEQAMAQGHEYSNLLQALIVSAKFAATHDAAADVKLSNIMVRPRDGELVLVDPIAGNYFQLTGAQQEAMAEFFR